MKKPLLIHFPEDVDSKLRAYSGSHGRNLTQTVVLAVSMFIDAVLRTEAEQAALLGE